jgi:hypothetical protein
MFYSDSVLQATTLVSELVAQRDQCVNVAFVLLFSRSLPVSIELYMRVLLVEPPKQSREIAHG